MLERLDKAGRFLEDMVLVVILTSMILLACGQIVMRNFFDLGVIWGDELLRLMVLWLAVGGAVAASRANKHINIAVLDRFLPGVIAQLTRIVIFAFTAMICGLMAWFSLRFVMTTHEFGDVLLSNVPAWILQAPLPLGFALMAWRYTLAALKEGWQLIRKAPGS